MEPLVQMIGITKSFPGVVALSDVTFDVLPGEVHVLLGENGAGKSTLMKILSGVYQPNEGELKVNGKSFHGLDPKTAKDNGISIIYQELSVIDTLSIMENLCIGNIPTHTVLHTRIVDKKAMKEQAQEILDSIGLDRRPEELVRNLNISEKQMVEVGKTFTQNAQIIIMDEPTSSLSEKEVDRLFTLVKNLKNKGKGIVYISHKMDELAKIGDRVTVLKDGKTVGTRQIGEVTTKELITMMVGRKLEDRYQRNKKNINRNKVILEVDNLTRKDKKVVDASFKLYEGEVLGFSGLIGAGRSELMGAIYGIAPTVQGEIKLNGKSLHITSPYDALKLGIGLVSENRRETGFFWNFSIKKNIAIAKQLVESKAGGLVGLVDFEEEKEISRKATEDMSIKCTSINQGITQLSGGNQQKVILGKWLSTNLKLLIFDEPTKGIDIGTKAEIYKLMHRLAQQGIGIIVISSEMPELLAVCDRIVVMGDGRIKGTFEIEDATEEKLLSAAVQ